MSNKVLHLLIGFLILPCFLFSQKIKKQDKERIIEVCKKHLEYRNLINQDSQIDIKDWAEYTSIHYILSSQKKSLYYSQLYDDIPNTEFKVKGFYENDTTFGCEIVLEDYLEFFWLDVKKINEKFIVAGMNGGIFSEKEVVFWDSLLLTVDDKLAEREVVKNTVKEFFDAMSEANLTKNYTKLKEVTTAESFELYYRKQRIDSIRGYNFKKQYEIREFDYVQIYGDSADCRTLVKGYGGTQINLIKKENRWIVTGENGPRDYKKRIEKLKIKELELIEKKDFLNIVPILDSAFREFMVNNNEQLLQKICSEASFGFFKKLKKVCGKYNPKMLDIYGLKRSRSLSYVTLNSDTATLKGLYTNFHFIKLNDIWQLKGIANNYDSSLNLINLVDEFENIKKSFSFSYSINNIKSKINNENVSTPFYFDIPPEGDIKKDTVIREPIADFRKPARFIGGGEAIYSYLKENIKFPKDKKGQVLVSFVIETDGSTSQIEIIEGEDKELNKEAHRLITNMPKWIPAYDFNKTKRSRYNLIIPFN